MQPGPNIFAVLGLATGLGAAAAGAQDEGRMVAFTFREPAPVTYHVPIARGDTLRQVRARPWLRAVRAAEGGLPVELSRQVVVQFEPGADVAIILRARPLTFERWVAEQVCLLTAPDVWTAACEAEALAAQAGVRLSHPVRRLPMITSGPYSLRPNDPYFLYQWNLENRASNGSPLGVDLNVRAAWPHTRGEGVLVAVGDDGVELSHPEFVSRAMGQPHFNFENGTTNGAAQTAGDIHATGVAGLALADGGNGVGMSGVAPAAWLASWKMLSASEAAIMDMFQYQSNRVSVQNHSWLLDGAGLLAPGLLMELGLSNALTLGRGGRGIVMTRPTGNGRTAGLNANDQFLTADPRVITVAGVRSDGRVADYSTPGASVLVAAPVGNSGFFNLFMTDRQGPRGYNVISYTNDLADYTFNSLSPAGTSFASPQIAGVAALLLAANTNLNLRDVQQLLLLSARHFDFADPDLTTSGAGLRFSHNLGFGVPDAGHAVTLARSWSNRPAAVTLSWTSTHTVPIPDEGFSVRVTGDGLPASLTNIAGLMPGESLHPSTAPGELLRPDVALPSLPLVDVGLAASAITTNLTGKGALIRRGVDFFSQKLQNATAAGASFAIVYNDAGDGLIGMVLIDFTRLPSIFIGQSAGEALVAQLTTNAGLRAQVRIDPATVVFAVTNTLVCEHVGVRLKTTHAQRRELRLTLISPAGTRSILQRASPMPNGAGPADWTYFSTQHFFEGSAGNWTVQVSDEQVGNTGSVTFAELQITGVPIADIDADGLGDGWEMTHFRTLGFGPRDDPDGDGYNNAREQVMGTRPTLVDGRFLPALNLSIWNEQLVRLSWPAVTNRSFDLLRHTNAAGSFSVLTNVSGRFPEAEAFVPYTNSMREFFRLQTGP